MSEEEKQAYITSVQLEQILSGFARSQQENIQLQFNQLQSLINSSSSSSHASSPPTSSSLSSSPSNMASHSSNLPSRVKISAPSNFTGKGLSNIDYWIFEMNQYLNVCGVPDSQKLLIASGYLKETAGQWWSTQVNQIKDWDDLKIQLKQRFQPLSASHTARYQLSKLYQGTMNINDYINRFQYILQLINDMNEADQIHYFIRGLRANLFRKISLQEPKTLNQAMLLAVKIESLMEKVAHTMPTMNNSPYSNSSFHSSPLYQDSSASSLPSPSSSLFPPTSSATSSAMELGNVNVDFTDEDYNLLSEEYDRYLTEGDDYIQPADDIDSTETTTPYDEEDQQQQLHLNAIQINSNSNSTPFRSPFSSSSRLSRDDFIYCYRNRLCLRCKRPGHISRNCRQTPASSSSSWRNTNNRINLNSRNLFPSSSSSFYPTRRSPFPSRANPNQSNRNFR